MKITKKQLKRIIKEEFMKEDSSDDTFEMVEVIVDALGAETTLDNVIQALERSKAQEVLQYIIQQYEIPWTPEGGYEG